MTEMSTPVAKSPLFHRVGNSISHIRFHWGAFLHGAIEALVHISGHSALHCVRTEHKLSKLFLEVVVGMPGCRIRSRACRSRLTLEAKSARQHVVSYVGIF
jgi:hypothetical protein